MQQHGKSPTLRRWSDRHPFPRIATVGIAALALLTLHACVPSVKSSDATATTETPDTAVATTTEPAGATTPETTASGATTVPVTSVAASTTVAPPTTTLETPTTASMGLDDQKQAYGGYRECLAENGVDLDKYDDSVNGGSIPDLEQAESDLDTLLAAAEVCADLIADVDPTANMTPEQLAAFEAWSIDLERCITAKGIDEPADASDLDLDAISRALSECQAEVPMPPELAEFADQLRP